MPLWPGASSMRLAGRCRRPSLMGGAAGSIATTSRHRCSKGQGAIHPTQPSGAYPPHRSKSQPRDRAASRDPGMSGRSHHACLSAPSSTISRCTACCRSTGSSRCASASSLTNASSRIRRMRRLARLHLPLVRRRGETWVLKGPSAGHMPDPVLVKALRSAHAMLHHDDGGLPVLVTGPDTPYRRRLVRLAFLAPEIQRAIVEGRQSAGVTLTQLLKGPIPLAWPQQAVQIGIATSPE